LSSSISAPTTSAGASARAATSAPLAPVTPPVKAASKFLVAAQELGWLLRAEQPAWNGPGCWKARHYNHPQM